MLNFRGVTRVFSGVFVVFFGWLRRRGEVPKRPFWRGALLLREESDFVERFWKYGVSTVLLRLLER